MKQCMKYMHVHLTAGNIIQLVHQATQINPSCPTNFCKNYVAGAHRLLKLSVCHRMLDTVMEWLSKKSFT